MNTRTKARPLFDPEIVRGALAASLAKLDPRHQIRNPVMFVVLAGTLVTASITAQRIVSGAGFGFELACSLILLFTVWFANFAEAVAEARGRGQAASLRSARRDLSARRLLDNHAEGRNESVAATTLRKGDRVLVLAGEYVPADGEIIGNGNF